MSQFYNIKHFILGEPAYSGHETYPNAFYVNSDLNNKKSNVIFKKNKFGKAGYSRMEVLFTKVAALFLERNTTPDQALVYDDSSNILGIGVEHLCYVIEKKEGLNTPYYSLLNPNKHCGMQLKKIDKPANIPLYFLDKLPQGFFNQLQKKEKENKLSIDYASLASIFTTSYTLEEDDLHKGNFGFYLIQKDNKPRVVFFKIDHDLMFANSIMSFYTSRFYHLLEDVNAFNICAEDLLDFPLLRHSANAYWPAKNSWFANPFANKDYNSSEEIHAFSDLKSNPEFSQAKWMYFLKHILIPQELIELKLKESLDVNKPYDRAQISLVTHATITRQSQLRAVLFSIKEFRDFVAHLSQDNLSWLKTEASNNQEQYSTRVESNLQTLQSLCVASDFFEEKDTPLHVAIKLGDYRYEETLQMFGSFINCKNSSGKSPLDTALDLHLMNKSVTTDIRNDNCFIMKHLLENNAEETRYFRDSKHRYDAYLYEYHSDYLTRAGNSKDYDQLKETLRDIGEDHRFCLKFKKNLAIECVRLYIEANQKNPELRKELVQLKNDINGDSSEHEAAPVKYIRQLRSKLWIVRQIRGLYGWTSTQGEMNTIIDNQLSQMKPDSNYSSSFFSIHQNKRTKTEERITIELEFKV